MSDEIAIDLQADLLARLRSDSVLAPVNIISESVGDLQTLFDLATGIAAPGSSGKCGVVIVVSEPMGMMQVAPGSMMPPVKYGFSIKTYENVVINRDPTIGTNLRALRLARRITRVLSHFIPVGVAQIVEGGKPAFKAIPFLRVEHGIGYENLFEAVEADPDTYEKIATPVITPAAAAGYPQTVTITCNSSGVDIWYTTDATYPWPGTALNVSTAVKYTAPFSIPSAKVVRAAAYRAGQFNLPSDAQMVIYS